MLLMHKKLKRDNNYSYKGSRGIGALNGKEYTICIYTASSALTQGLLMIYGLERTFERVKYYVK